MKKSRDIVKDLKKLADAEGITMLGNFASRNWSPFCILIGTILSARSKDEVTESITENLFDKYPNAEKLSRAKTSSIEKIIKSIGYYRNKAKYVKETAKIINKRGNVPDNFEELCKLPGVGRKVANCVLVYAFNKSAIPVDIHVHRISNRMGWVETKTPEKTEIALSILIPKKYWMVINEHLVRHGKSICKPRNPKCEKCVLTKTCPKRGVKHKKRDRFH